MKNVLFFTSSLSKGGAEKMLAKLSKNFPDNFNKFFVIYDDSKIDYDYDGKLLKIKIKKTKNIIGKIFNFFIKINELKKIKKYYNINYSISFLDSPNLINIFSKTNDKIIISVRNFKSISKKNIYSLFNSIFIKLFYNMADSIVSVSNGIKEDLIKNYKIKKTKIKVIHNFYDIKSIEKLSLEKIEDDYLSFFGEGTIINVGRLERQKGQEYLIRSFSMIKKQIPYAKLVIIGNGSLKKRLLELSYQLKLEDDILFLDFTKNPYKYIKNSKLFVLSSLFEGFPNVICEAMVCSVPVIATNCKTGPNEILTDKKDSINNKEINYADYGVLIPDITIDNYSNISTAVVNMLQNKQYQEFYAIVGRKKIELLDKKNIISQWVSLLQ